MSRLQVGAFGALVLATIGAFFVTQHLKVTTPLIAGDPRPVPGAINPYGASCNGVNHSRMWISFYLQHRSDDVSVYVVDASGDIVATLASGRHMAVNKRAKFYWDGHEDDGSVAPDGTYYLRVALIHQGRTFQMTNRVGTPLSFQVLTVPPHPVIRSVSPSLIPDGNTPVSIHYKGNEHRGGMIVLYRTDLPGDPVVKRFRWKGSVAHWDGLINGQPAPAGTYLVGMNVYDAACNLGRFPQLMPPLAGSTQGAGVTVRYLAAQPPVTPVPAGSAATVYVDSRGAAYRWTLWRVGAHKPDGHGLQRAGAFTLRVKLPPAQDAGLYHLVVTSGPHITDVPLIADHPGKLHQARVLVVLPALTWQGENPVDDPPYDGLPNTLESGGPIELARVLANGLPAGWADESAFLAYLDHAGLRYDLTTDLALIDGVGPSLAGHAAVVFAGSERWLPRSFATALRSYVQGGGNVVSLGIDSLRRTVTISGGRALNPTGPASVDALGARPGALVAHSQGLITVIHDGLGIFATTSGAFEGYSSYQPFASVSAPATIASAAGTTDSTPAIIGYRLGRGAVVDVGLVGFGQSLTANVDAKELVLRLWKVLA